MFYIFIFYKQKQGLNLQKNTELLDLLYTNFFTKSFSQCQTLYCKRDYVMIWSEDQTLWHTSF